MKKITSLIAAILLLTLTINTKSEAQKLMQATNAAKFIGGNSKSLQANITSVTNVLCAGNNTGSATVTASRGEPPYTYLWQPGADTSATDTAMVAGIYTVLVTDNLNDTVVLTVTITQPNPLNIFIISHTNVTCQGGSNGSAGVGASGGTSAYDFLWSDGNTNTTDSNLSAGTYTVTVTDSNGCTASIAIPIGINSTLQANLGAVTNVSCFGQFNGKASVIPAGGVPPYKILWLPVMDTTPTATGLPASTYTSQVTDNVGCLAQTTATVAQPAPLLVTATNIATVAYAYVTGGVSPYTFSWSPGGGTSATFSALLPGTYTVTVNDANLCSNSAIVTIPVTDLSFYLSNPTTNCGNPSYVNFSVLATSTPNTLFNNCIIAINYDGGEFAGDDFSNGGIIVTRGANFQPAFGNDYNYFDSTTAIGDSVMQITLGDSSAMSPSGTMLTASAQALFNISLRIQNSCQSGTISLIPLAQFAYYTDTVSHVVCTNCALPCDSCNLTKCCASDSTGCIQYCYANYCCSDSIQLLDTNFQYNGIIYSPDIIATPVCSPTIFWGYTDPIMAGTNAHSVPANSSILTIPGCGFGITKDTIVVCDANSGFNGKGNEHYVPLDTDDILSWSENQIVVKMPSDFLYRGSTPGSGPFTIYNTCGGSATANIQINYNIENYNSVHGTTKFRGNIVMSNDSESYIFRCDTSVSHNPKAYACVKKAIKTWNCYTGVNWRCGADTTLDSTKQDGVSAVYFSNAIAAGIVMETEVNYYLPCFSFSDSVDFAQESDIAINGNITNWSYDTAGIVYSSDSTYFYDAILHELGHAHRLGHINDTLSLMYWYTAAYRPSIVTGGTYPGPATLEGGLDVVNTSAAPSNAPSILGCSAYSILVPSTRMCIDPTLSVPPISKNGYSLNLYPNPINNGDLMISYQLNKDAYIYFKITDCTGRVLISSLPQQKPAGNYTAGININNLSAGVYFFVATINGVSQTIKFVKL